MTFYMKILQINAFCGVGSTGKIAVDIANSLSDNDKCYIAYGYLNTDYCNTYKLLKFSNSTFYKIKLLYNRIIGTTGKTNKSGTKKFIKWIKQYKPDIIHLHNIHGDYIHLKTLIEYLKSSRIPVVWTLHDCWPFTGRCSYFDYNKCFKWKTGCEKCKFKNVYPITYFFDKSRRDWNQKHDWFTGIKNLTIVTPSQWLANYVSLSFLGEYPIKVINNGIDLSKFYPTKDYLSLIKSYKLKNKKILLGVAGSWSFRKGLDYFVQLSKILPTNYQIVLIGLNKQQIKDLPNNIIGLSSTSSQDELRMWYSLANVYINPTLDDNYPTTNIEAQACGTPVITFNTGGSPETIKSNFGIVTEEKTVLSLYNAIESILSNTKVPKIDTYIYSKERAASEYVKLYNEITSSY